MAADLDVLGTLDTICELGPGRLPDHIVDDATSLRRKADERLARGDRYTVVAFAGGTGVGKSALFNALLGEPVAREGVRRPTTAVPLAAYREHDEPLGELLDWLEAPERRPVGETLPEDLVLIDLPDHDSVEEHHRTTATRFARRVDVVIWVLDPIKYTRADSHYGSLAELTAHSDNLLVVLNRIDELDDNDRQLLERDLRAHLIDEGHMDARVLLTSAKTGEGVDELREAVLELSERLGAAVRRLIADVHVVAERAAEHLDDLPELDTNLNDLVDAVIDATGAHQRAEEAAITYRSNAIVACRSPIARAVRSPLGLARGIAERLGIPIGETSAPPQHSAPSRVRRALAEALPTSDTAGQLYARLDASVHEAARDTAPMLVAAVDRFDTVPQHRTWWRATAMLRGITEATATFGLLWLLVIGLVPWLGLPPLPVPMLTEDWSWPAALFAGGLAGRVVFGVLGRTASAVGARRTRRRSRTTLRKHLAQIVDADLMEPLRREVECHEQLQVALAEASRDPVRR